MNHFTSKCPNCSSQSISVQTLICNDCETKVEGNLKLPRLARLNPEERNFVELFVIAGGSIKEMEKILGISYPTVKSKLDKVINSLNALKKDEEQSRIEILEKLENGEITSEQAIKFLKEKNI